ncbi:MAG: hypothetical protein AAFR03_02100 [Pseudomonadota bacterium]
MTIRDQLKQHDLNVAHVVERRDVDKNAFFAFIRIKKDKRGFQVPSNSRLSEIARQFAEIDVEIHFILRSSDIDDIEGGVRATLLHSYGKYVRNAFLSVHGAAGEVWIEPKTQEIQSKLNEVERTLESYFGNTFIVLDRVRLTTKERLPTDTALLSSIRQLSPCGLEHLKDALGIRGFSIPPDGWLSRSLDRLRKRGHVVRRKDGQYALSIQGLRSLGTSKTRMSPDVRRVLALSRRGA